MLAKGSDQRSQCASCGKPGARWIVRTNSSRDTVHKHCGQILAKSAPAGSSVKIFPSKELRMEWQAKRFWANKFSKAGLDTATGRPVQSC